MRLLKNSLESREEDKLKTLVKKGTDHSVHDHCSTWRQELSSGDRAVCPFFHQRLKLAPPGFRYTKTDASSDRAAELCRTGGGLFPGALPARASRPRL